MHDRTFRAMNTEVRILSVDARPGVACLLQSAVAQFTLHERTLSRFDPTSELAALNCSHGRWTPVSHLMLSALVAAREAFERTRGLFDPAILPVLETAGYDRSFECLQLTERHVTPRRPATPHAAAAHDGYPYEIDRAARSVRLAPDVRLDLGGIGKGLAVDAAAALLTRAGGFLVDAGGDIRAGGRGPEDGPWGIAIQNPLDPAHDIAVLALADRAVATSSTARRRWLQDGEERHHLIDPRTGRSAAGDVAAATVVAADCATAEVFAKAALIAGSQEGLALLETHNLAGLLICTDGRVRVNDAMQPLLVSGAVKQVAPRRPATARQGG